MTPFGSQSRYPGKCDVQWWELVASLPGKVLSRGDEGTRAEMPLPAADPVLAVTVGQRTPCHLLGATNVVAWLALLQELPSYCGEKCLTHSLLG